MNGPIMPDKRLPSQGVCRRVFLQTYATVLLVLTMPATLRAGDWPQILGPHRNGQADGESLLDRWPEGGPQVLWSYPLGAGFAGPAIVGQRVVVFHRVGENERLESLDAASGKPQWHIDFPASYRGSINPDSGPRCVPLVSGKNVYAFGAAGDLYAVDLASGQKKWTRSVYAEMDGSEGYFGAGSTPIVAGGNLLVNVGGRESAGLVAFDLESGRTVWKATDERASYSSPTLASFDGRQYAVFVTRLSALAIDPANGKTLFRFPFGRRGPTVNAATPLVFGDYLFLSASYGIGARLSKIQGGQAQTIWASNDVLSSQYSTSVYHKGYLYGIDGREDLGEARLRCIEAQTGKVVWNVDDFEVGHLLLAGDRLLILCVDGHLVLSEASPKGFHKLAEADVLPPVTRALPALSRGRLVLRNTTGDGKGKLVSLLVGRSEQR